MLNSLRFPSTDQRRTFGHLKRRAAALVLPLAAGLGAALVLLLAAGAATPAQAAPTAASHDWPSSVAPCDGSLQACLDGIPEFDTIVVSGAHTVSLTLNRAISLTGVASNTAILTALPGQRVLTVTGSGISNSVVISGLTFTGGDLGDGTDCPADCGGGVLLADAARPRLVNVRLINNRAVRGGGLYAEDQVSLTDSQVLSNTAIELGGGAVVLGAATVSGVLFQGNLGTGSGGGGLVAANTLALTDTQFISNTSLGLGGGAVALGAATVSGGLFQGNQCTESSCGGGGLVAANTLALTDTQFISNTALGLGGGAMAPVAATVNGGLFQGNRCTEADCRGGGLVAANTLGITGTQFISNASAGNGGGVEKGGNGDLQITQALFAGNTAAGQGGGLYYSGDSDSLIVNSLLAGNQATTGAALFVVTTGSGSLSLGHNTLAAPGAPITTSAVRVTAGSVFISNTILADHNIGIDLAGGFVSEDYNLLANVLFASSGAVNHGGNSFNGTAGFANPAAGDYRLTLASSAIDTAVNTGLSVDFFGLPRPVGGGYDIGYHEAWWADLALSKTGSQTSAQPGENITYTLVVSNTGPHTAAGVVVSDSLPAALTNGNWTCAASAGANCVANGVGSLSTAVTLTAGSKVTVTVVAQVADETTGVFTNTAELLLPNGLQDPTPADHSASFAMRVQPPVYLPLVIGG